MPHVDTHRIDGKPGDDLPGFFINPDMVQKQVQILQHTQEDPELSVLDDSAWRE